MTKKVLILGISGFTGRNFYKYLINNQLFNEFTFFGVDKFPNQDFDSQFIQFIETDLTLDENIENVLLEVNPDYILNLIGLFDSKDVDMTLKINYGISQKLLEFCVKNNLSPQNIVLIGSAAEYGYCDQLPINETTPLRPISSIWISKNIANGGHAILFSCI